MLPNLFTVPAGFIRDIPPDKLIEYGKRYRNLGPFRKHQYDIDICVLYRQIDDLGKKGNPEAENYARHIKENVSFYLTKENMDPDFYFDYFFYVLTPYHPFYLSHLGLFLSMSDLFAIMPLLNYHLTLFTKESKKGRTEDDFLNELEFNVCNFFRTNRFPEDYYAKHDKIINWVYSKREFAKYQSELDNKINLLIGAFNKIVPSKIPTEIKKGGKKRPKQPKIEIIESRREILFNDLKEFFNKESWISLKQLIAGQEQELNKIIFLGQANQLVDVFRIYAEAKYILAEKRAIARWICDHFLYFSDSMKNPELFDGGNVEWMIYNKKSLAKGSRIELSELAKQRFNYYI